MGGDVPGDEGIWRGQRGALYVGRPGGCFVAGFGLIEGEALWGYGHGGAQGFFEKCGWDGVVDGFEVRKN